jgi:glycosyltransferase involved in cell wall biosynthesis
LIFVDSFAFLLLVLTLSNLVTVKTLKPLNQSQNYDFDILIPLRNEERNVTPLIDSLSIQGGTIFTLDDNSTDGTFLELSKFGSMIKIFQGRELPHGWLGKSFACHQLAVASDGKYLVFIDADVRLNEGAINSAIFFMEKMRWDFISAYPRQLSSGFLQRLIQPLLQWSWFATVPMFYSYRKPNKSMAVANGQFFVIKRDAYLTSGGHKAIKGEVIEDMELARNLIGSGYKGGVVDGSRIASCRMYENDSEMISGYAKSLWRAFGSPLGTLLAILVIGATVLPFIYFSFGCFAILLSRLLVALKTRGNPFAFLLHPLSMATLILLILYSNYLKSTGRLTWKGRTL